MQLPTTIDEVITKLDSIIVECSRTNNRIGYFAALYYRVTCRIRDGILRNEFEGNARMERLDVLFANRFIEAWELWREKKEPTQSWKIAFGCAQKRRVIVLQHLLLGINAHINLDLGIAAVETMKGEDIDALKRDFNAINAVLGELTYKVINQVNRVSPFLSLMGFHATNTNSFLIQFSISNARDGAWCFAEELSLLSGDDARAFIAERDKTIQQVASGLVRQRGLIRFTLFLIHLFEWKKPAKIISVLNSRERKISFAVSARAVAAKRTPGVLRAETKV